MKLGFTKKTISELIDNAAFSGLILSITKNFAVIQCIEMKLEER